MEWKSFVFVFFGGGLGSLLRFLLGKWLNPLSATFFFGTFAANFISCFVLGVLAGFMLQKALGSWGIFFWMAGFCGGFSTFSTFSLELYKLQNLHWAHAFGYLALSVVAGLGMIFAGMATAQWWMK